MLQNVRYRNLLWLENKGFTLLELLVVLAIVSVMMMISIPSYRSFRLNHQANVAIYQLYRVINVAKSEAIKRNQWVTLCPSVDGKSCGINWSQGYLLFIDLEEDGTLDEGDAILKYNMPINHKAKLTWRNFQNKPYLQLTPLGNTHFQNGRFDYELKDYQIKRSLIINAQGRMRLE